MIDPLIQRLYGLKHAKWQASIDHMAIGILMNELVREGLSRGILRPEDCDRFAVDIDREAAAARTEALKHFYRIEDALDLQALEAFHKTQTSGISDKQALQELKSIGEAIEQQSLKRAEGA